MKPLICTALLLTAFLAGLTLGTMLTLRWVRQGEPLPRVHFRTNEGSARL